MIFKKEKGQPILQEVSPEDLMKYRLSKKSGLVLKIGSQLFLAKEPDDSALLTKNFGSGLCKTCDNICKGCQKVQDLTLSIQLGFGYKYPYAVEKYGRPEKYDFITFAIEIFDGNNSECIVAECNNFCERNPSDYEVQYFAETI